jgi:membrane protein implicated in regulation of membrane protease activity
MTENKSKGAELKRWQTNPAMLLLLTMLAIFASEFLVMIALGLLSIEDRHALPLVDAILLSVLVFPVLYFLFFQPLTAFTKECRRQAEENRRLIEELRNSRGKKPDPDPDDSF